MTGLKARRMKPSRADQKFVLGRGRGTRSLDPDIVGVRRWNEANGHPFNWTFRGYPLPCKAA
jgi:hypothetical protein